MVGHQSCDSQFACSSPGRALLRSGLRQATYTCVPVSLSSITRCWPNGGDLCGWKHGFRQRAYGRIRAENLTKTPKIR